MSELLLVKTPINLNISRQPVVEQVVGVALADSPITWEHDYKPTGKEAEEVFTTDEASVLENIAEFYATTRALSPEQRRFHNCHALAWYAFGGIDTLTRYERYVGERDEKTTSPRKLKPAQAYLVNSNGTMNHSVIGINRPDHSLSVLGDNNIMTVAANRLLLDLYDGTSLHQNTPAYAEL
ncbi:MAG: hypothetical protein WAQ27_03705 [Candidatus Microsaccharimonas sp.]